jgi:hypothetical protein
VLHLPEQGRVLRGESLIGLTLVVANGDRDVALRIDGIDTDATQPREPLTLYRASILMPGGGAVEACQPDPTGRRAALIYRDATGRHYLTCTSGADGKCILFGYRPWKSVDGVPMRDLHQACIHMLRADYGGDNRPTTREGTVINIYDRFGIQLTAPGPGLTFEAAWGADGAICVARPRIPDHVSLEQLGERYPALRGRLGPEACSEEAMRADPRALLFNDSPGG